MQIPGTSYWYVKHLQTVPGLVVYFLLIQGSNYRRGKIDLDWIINQIEVKYRNIMVKIGLIIFSAIFHADRLHYLNLPDIKITTSQSDWAGVGGNETTLWWILSQASTHTQVWIAIITSSNYFKIEQHSNYLPSFCMIEKRCKCALLATHKYISWFAIYMIPILYIEFYF